MADLRLEDTLKDQKETSDPERTSFFPAEYLFRPVNGELLADKTLSLDSPLMIQDISKMDAVHMDPVTKQYVLTVNLNDHRYAPKRYANWINITQARLTTYDEQKRPVVKDISPITVELAELPFYD